MIPSPAASVNLEHTRRDQAFPPPPSPLREDEKIATKGGKIRVRLRIVDKNTSISRLSPRFILPSLLLADKELLNHLPLLTSKPFALPLTVLLCYTWWRGGMLQLLFEESYSTVLHCILQ
jgi:hypothetical protein